MNKDFIARFLSIFPLAILLGAIVHIYVPDLYAEEEILTGVVFFDVILETLFIGFILVFYAEFAGYFIRMVFFRKLDPDKENTVTINVAGVQNQNDRKAPPLSDS